MSGLPPPDPSALSPNDLRRLRVKLNGRSPEELLGSGVTEDVFQTMILAIKLRDDPEFTWEQAGDIAPSTVFDMTGGEPPPPTPPPAGPGGSGGRNAGSTSRKRPTASASAPSSAASTASPATSTTP